MVVTARGSGGGPDWTGFPADPAGLPCLGYRLGLIGQRLVDHPSRDCLADLDSQFQSSENLVPQGIPSYS